MTNTCNNCACNKVCNHDVYGFENCGNFIPAADVVEVIRCKDCAYYGGITFGNICRRWSALNVKNCTKPDDFCSYGKRKDGDGNEN